MFSDELLALATQLGLALKARHQTLALAESCTGGLAAALMTEIAGSSAWFDSAIVSYSNQAKQQLLDVPPDTLQNFGAVSEQTALAMALGMLAHSQASISASITGIAGPDGGSADKPVGTVCFAWAGRDIPASSCTLHFAGNRQQVREQAVMTALQGILQRLTAI